MTNWIPFEHRIPTTAGVITHPGLLVPGPECQGGVRPPFHIIHKNIVCYECGELVDAWAPDPDMLDNPEISSGFFEDAGISGGGMNSYPGVPGGACSVSYTHLTLPTKA